jgi:hypothetical protein
MKRVIAIIIAFACFALLYLSWRSAKRSDEALKDAVLIEELKPDKPDLKLPFPAKILRNYKPLLRMDSGISVRPLQVETVRTKDGFVSTMWARRAKDSIIVDWAANTVVKGNVDNARDADCPAAQYVPPGMLLFGGGGKLVLKVTDTQSYKIPWERKTEVYPLALDEHYPYAFANELDRTTGLTSVLVVDIPSKKPAGIIPVPPVQNSVSCIFKPQENYLMVFDNDWSWIVMIDLSKPMFTAETTATQNASNSK